MTKISRKPLKDIDLGNYVNNLWAVFTILDDKSQVRLLFKDLFTHTEYKMFAKRLEVARRLIEGKTYESIAEDLKVTQNMITRISNILAIDGKGYAVAYQILRELEKDAQRSRDRQQQRLERKRFPRFREQVLWEALLSGTGKKLVKAISSRNRKLSVRKKLSVN